MEKKEVKLNQEEANSSDGSNSDDNLNSSERKTQKYLTGKEIIHKIQIENQGKANINNEVLIKEKNDLNNNIKKDSDCCKLCLLLSCSLLQMIIMLIVKFIYLIAFFYYKNYCKKCKAQIYNKLDKILSIYIAIYILDFINIINNVLLLLPFKRLDFYSAFGKTISILLIIIALVLIITFIFIVQKNYNRTTTWENCGYFKGWILSWLIIIYSGNIYNFCKGCFSKYKERNKN